MGKYESLPKFLSRQKVSSLRISFGEIEAILGFALPEAAYAEAAWWSNSAGHAHAGNWLQAGWLTVDVDLSGREVTFERHPSAASMPTGDPFGCMADTITLVPGVDLTAPSEEVWNAEAGRLLNE